MTKPNDIPQDVWDYAEIAVKFVPSGDDNAQIDSVARAILAERERCAQVADEWAFDEFELAQATEAGRVVDRAARDIAAAIRNPNT